MISTVQPHPVNDGSSSHCVALPPHIYSPSESLNSPTNAMYPHLYPGSPSPSYTHSGYEQYYSKETWSASARSNPWLRYYPPPRSSSLPEAAINPKVTILPSQPALAPDLDTPSSTSSHSIPTPSSPFGQHDVGEAEFQAMEFDEFEFADEEEDYIDSDFVEEMEGIDEAEQGLSPLYGASAPHAIKSTSALEGALGETPSSSYSSYSSNLGVYSPADRRLSVSVPGYYTGASHRSAAVSTHHRGTEKAPSPSPPGSLPVASYPQPHPYTHHNYSSSTSLFAPTPSSSLYHQPSPSSLAGAVVSSAPASYSSLTTPNRLPILQPQPIRPIPPIPLADLAASATENVEPLAEPCGVSRTSQPLQALSPLPLLCQPVSDAVRYQLKEPPACGALDDICYDEENTSESTCEDLITATQCDRFAHEGLTFSQEHHLSGGTCSVEGKIGSCGCVGFPIRWR